MHVRPLQHGTVAEHEPLLLAWQHPLAPDARVPQVTPVPVQVSQVPPPAPQFAFVAPPLHMAEPELVVPQQPSQLTGPQAMASHRQVVVLNVEFVPHWLLTHCWAPGEPQSTSPVGHSHAQVVALRTLPPVHSA